MSLPKLFTHLCICGCGMISRTLSSKPGYASLGCKELHTHKRQVIGVKFSNHGTRASKRAELVENLQRTEARTHLDPGTWLTAAIIAQRLGTHATNISKFAADGIIPFDNSTGQRRYKLSDVVAAIKLYNNTPSKGKKKILTKYFRPR